MATCSRCRQSVYVRSGDDWDDDVDLCGDCLADEVTRLRAELERLQEFVCEEDYESIQRVLDETESAKAKGA